MNEPLLLGAEREEAISRVREIARALDRPQDEWILTRPNDETGLRSISLALGRSGHALFYAVLAKSGIEPGAAAIAERLLAESIELLPDQSMDASLLCGFPGIAWTTEFLCGLFGADPTEDPNESIDEALIGALEDPSFVPAYDLIDGLAGMGVYALERARRPTGPVLASLILGRLESFACPQTVGLSWPSGLITRSAQGKDVLPNETYFNLGLSHGVPGVIGILARFLAEYPHLAQRAEPLLEGAVAWILAQRLPDGMIGAFADHVAPEVEREPARLAWCYGDPGVAAALFTAGRALRRPDVEAFALEVAHIAVRRPFETTGVVDAGFCHGSAGVAHLFHRLGRAGRDETCLSAARVWMSRLLERAGDRPHVAGFPTFCFERTRDGEYIEDPALLTGAAGAGLVLLSAIDPGLPTWDRPFLADLPG